MTASAPGGEFTWSLRVDRAEFAKALRSVGKAGRSLDDAEAILTLDNGEFTLELAGSSCSLPAEGAWPSEVRLPGEALQKLAGSLPTEDPLPITVQGERLFVARFSIPCKWRLYSHKPSTPVKELLPANAELFEILMVRTRCSAEEIDAAGAAPLIANAQSRLSALCAKAARFLQKYGVTARHLETLCEQHIEEGSRQFREADRAAIGQVARAWELLAPLGVQPDELKALMDECLRNAWGNPK